MAKSKNKRKNGKIKANNKSRPQKDFPQLVADAVNARLLATVQQEIYSLGGQLAQNQTKELSGVVTRLAVLEKLMCEKMSITEDQLAERVASMEDEALGLEQVNSVENGDLVRLTVSSKQTEEKEYKGESQVQVQNCGNSPFTLPRELETALIGLADGQTIEVPFGEGKRKAKMTIDRVSRAIGLREEESSEDSEPEDQIKEAKDGDQNEIESSEG